MLTIDALNEFGADTKEGMKRCLNNEEFYLKMVSAVTTEKSFDVLREALEAGDLKAGFEAAHALKGVLANLSLTALLEPAVEITEYLRAGTQMDYGPLLEKLLSKKDELKEICES